MEQSTGKLHGEVALVTGAARGMGAAIAHALAAAGSKVVVTDLNLAAAEATAARINHKLHSSLASAHVLDVTQEEQVGAVCAAIAADLGRLSILVNNAGILFPTRVGDISLQEWRQVLEVNLTGTFLCSKAVLPMMRQQGFGRIVNLSSSAGRSVSTLGGAHYTAAKAGVLGLTRAMAKELAADGILVNAICPGLIDTEMVHTECDAERIRNYEQSFPVARLGTPAEVAAVVVFLCCEGSYITGASIDVNGGDLMM